MEIGGLRVEIKKMLAPNRRLLASYIVNNFAKLYVRFTPILRELYVAHVKFT